MGGGTGGFTSIPSKTAEEAEGLFKRAVRSVEVNNYQEKQVRNVFISFSMSDSAKVNLLRAQAADERFGLEFRDYSVKEPFDEKWKQQVKEKIALTSATIVMIGPETASRPAVNFEIEESYRQGKKVIGVRIYRNQNDPIPQAMIDNKAPIVNWTMEEIQRELDKP